MSHLDYNILKPRDRLTDIKSPLNNNSYPMDDQWQFYAYEREWRWAEIRRYSDYIRRCASEPQMELNREKYIELYNMAVGLLRAVDSLDPDLRLRKKH